MYRILTVVLNLDRSHDRLKSVTSNCAEQGIEFTRLSAVDGGQISDLSEVGYDRELTLKYLGRELSHGEVGCYLSHLKAISTFLLSDADYMLVLEDDVEFAQPNVTQCLHNAIALSASGGLGGIGVANVGLAPTKLASEIGGIGGNTLVAAHYFPVTTTAILWGREAAQDFQNNCSKLIYPVDIALQLWAIHRKCGFGIIPAPCQPAGIESVIVDLGGRGDSIDKKNRLKLPTLYRKLKCYSGAIVARLTFRWRCKT